MRSPFHYGLQMAKNVHIRPFFLWLKSLLDTHFVFNHIFFPVESSCLIYQGGTKPRGMRALFYPHADNQPIINCCPCHCRCTALIWIWIKAHAMEYVDKPPDPDQNPFTAAKKIDKIPFDIKGDSTYPIQKARVSDARQILMLINSFAASNLMLPRGPQYIYENIRDFTIAVDDTVAGRNRKGTSDHCLWQPPCPLGRYCRNPIDRHPPGLSA